MMRSIPLRSLFALLAASACQSPGSSTPAGDTTTDGTTSPGSTSSTGATTDLPTSGSSDVSDGSASGSTTTPDFTTSSSSTTGDAPTSTSTTDATTSDTTGGGVVFPTECDDPLASPYVDALADTFFLNEQAVGPECGLVQNPPGVDCRDLEFGAAATYQIFRHDFGDPNPSNDTISLFAARFDAPQPKHDDLDVPPTSWVGARVKFHVVRPDKPQPWKAMVLQLLRFTDGDTWETGNGLGSTACMDPAASFRCRKCDDDDQPCVLPWAAGTHPFNSPLPAAEFQLAVDPGAQGLDVEIDLPVDAVPWLVDTGVMLVPEPQVYPGAIAVTTLEAAPQLGPQLSILYCPPVP